MREWHCSCEKCAYNHTDDNKCEVCVNFSNFFRLPDKEVKMIKEWKPGDIVYHINRDEDGYPLDVCGTVYLATVENYILSVALPCGIDNINEVMKYLAETTKKNFNSEIYVHPICDCYETYSEAEKARKEAATAWGSEEEEE